MLTNTAMKNPIAILMVAIAVCVLGYVSVTRLPVDLLPEITIPVVVVGAVYSGAGPKDIEASVTQPIERAVASVPNLKYIESTSRQGLSIVSASFDWGVDSNVVATDCIQKVQQIMARLPVGVQQPFVIKIDMTMMAVIGLTISGEGMDDRELYDLAYNTIEPQIEHIGGVASAAIGGGRVRQINVLTGRDTLASHGLSATDVVNSLANANFLMPSGSLRVGSVDYNVFTDTQIEEVDQIGDVVVRVGTENANPVHIKDIAAVEDGGEEQTNIVRIDGKPGITMWVRKQPQANTVEVVNGVMAELPKLHGIPPNVTVSPTFNQADYIKNSISSLINESIMGALMAIVIIFLFLRTFKSTFIIAISIPLSIMTTFVLLYFLGKQSMNIFTLGGLALGVGRVVDDSIVVLENIARYRSLGKNPWEAAMEGAREVAMPVLASTIVTVVVFFPIVFLSGVAKLLFIPLTLTVVFALAASYLAAMTLVPILSLKFVSQETDYSTNSQKPYYRFLNALKRLFDGLSEYYEAILRFALKHRALVVSAIIFVFIGTMALAARMGTDLFPSTDESQFGVTIKAPVGTRVEKTLEYIKKMETIVKQSLGEENIQTIISDAGIRLSGMGSIFGGNSGPHAGTVRVKLVPPANRKFSDLEAVEIVRKALGDHMAGVQTYFQTGGFMNRMMNFGSEAAIDIEVLGYDFDKSQALSKQIYSMLEKIPGISDVRLSMEDYYPELDVKINREKAAVVGLNTKEISQTVLTSVYGNLNIPGIFTDQSSGNQYSIVVRFNDDDRKLITDLEDVPITTKNGNVILLRTVADVVSTTGPLKIDRKYQQRIVHVTANTFGRSLGEVANEITSKLSEISVPEGFEVKLAGQRSEQKDSFIGLLLALGLALMLVYMTMASQFKSLKEPFIIMFSVPMGLIGVIWFLYLTGTPLSINAFMGIIMMVGIVLSNGILLVEFANVLHGRGYSIREAVVQAGKIRLRPILMTTVTTLLGVLPMAIGIGEGSESNVPLARAVAGGLLVSTLFTLVLIPILYTLQKESKKKPEEEKT